MRSLAEPAVLLRAALAAALTVLACYPRLANWGQRPNALWYLLAVVGWAAFVMWAAVFAWHERHGGVKLFRRDVSVQVWLSALGLGVAGGAVMFFFVDPTLREVSPTDFPRTASEWFERMLFNLALEQLFLCLAPFAFCARLFRTQRAGAIGVVLFSLLVFALKLQSLKTPLAGTLVALLAVFRTFSSVAMIGLLLRGGFWPLMLFTFVLQCRNLFALSP